MRTVGQKKRGRVLIEPIESRIFLSSYTVQTLVSFQQTDVYSPAGVTIDAQGDLFGVSINGGQYRNGSVYEIIAGSQAITTLESFSTSQGAPNPGLAIDTNGNLYGTTNTGYIFKIAASTHAYSAVANVPDFSSYSTVSGLTIDSHGNLYGVNSDIQNGSNFFELPSGGSTVSTLASGFYSAVAGQEYVDQFVQSLTVDSSGDVYGTAVSGGADGDGSVFEIVAGSGSVSLLASFTSYCDPNNGLAVDASGNVYGITTYGGEHSYGSIFEVVKNSRTITTLLSFDGTNGGAPVGGVTLSNGKLFGVYAGLLYADNGGIYQFTLAGDTLTELATIDSAQTPDSSILRDSAGDLFVTTGSGNLNDIDEIGGNVYELVPGASSATVVVTFNPPTDLIQPTGVVIDSQGDLFGAASSGGTPDTGAIFEIPAGTNQLNTLAGGVNSLAINQEGEIVGATDFSIAKLQSDGQTFDTYSLASPYELPRNVTVDASGNVFGIAYNYDTANSVVFEVLAENESTQTLATFSSQPNVEGDLAVDSAGDVYGADGFVGGYGDVFEVVAGSGTVSTFASFSPGSIGAGTNPEGLMIDRNGNLFGGTISSGVLDSGEIFEIPAGTHTLTPLAPFGSASVGYLPNPTFGIDSQGDLFGSTQSNGSGGDGSLWELPVGASAITPLLNLTSADPGRFDVVVGTHGRLYAESYRGGADGGGALLEFDPPIGPATHLTLDQGPANASAGASLGPITVEIDDANDNTVTTNTSSVTVTVQGATLSGTLTEPVVNGIATFNNLSITTAGTYSLSFTDSNNTVTQAASDEFTISPGTANKLVIRNISSAIAGQTIPSFNVDVADQYGNTVTGDSSTITLTGPSGAGLTGILQATAQNGVATFNDLSLTNASEYTFSASDQSLMGATSNEFTIAPAAASKLAFSGQISGGVAGARLNPIMVGIEDQYGNLVNNDNSTVTLSASNGVNPAGTFTSAADFGIATFSDLLFTQAGDFTFTITDNALTPLTSNSFTIAPAAAAKLVFTTSPSNAIAGTTLSPAIVAVEDQYGNLITTNSTVTLVTSDGAALGGTTTAAAQNGVATFAALSINSAGTHTLSASDGILSPAISNSFVVSPATASKLALANQPSSAFAGVTLPALAVDVEDQFGNVVTGNSSMITLAASSGANLGGTLSVAAQNGAASFNDLSVSNVGTYTLAASDGSLAGVTTTSFTISPAAAAKLVFISSPSNASAGATLSSTTVEVEDAYGNIITIDTPAITLTAAGGATLNGTATLVPANGVATFNNLSITKAGTYTLSASDGSLTSATSSSFSISPAAPASLQITAQPHAGFAGQTLSPLNVEVEDQFDNPADGSSVSISILTATGALSSANVETLPTQNGEASFTNLSIAQAGSYLLSAQNGALPSVTSNPITITYTSPQLHFLQQPLSSIAGNKFSVEVDSDDTSGNLASSGKYKVTLQILNNSGKVVGTNTANSQNGRAVFSKLSIQTAGTYTLQATTTASFAAAQSASFVVSPAAIKKLAFVTQPTGATHGNPFNVQLELFDQYGNLATNDDSTVTLALGSHPKNATLLGTTSEIVSGGDADIDGVILNESGNYTLKATDGALKATSKKFVVT